MLFGSRLQKALEKSLRDGQVEEHIRRLGDYQVVGVRDAQAICEALERVIARDGAGDYREWLQPVAGLFQSAESEAVAVLRERGIPLLARAFDDHFAAATGDDQLAKTLLFVLKILVMYGTEAGVSRLLRAAREPLDPEGFMWSVVLSLVAEGHPLRAELVTRLADPLPPAFIAVSFLDLANTMARQGSLPRHPFASPEGRRMLRAWLESANEEDHSYAHSATAALPFLGDADDLLGLALAHPDASVRIEAAWASARLGRQEGIDALAAWCLDVNHCTRACTLLAELEREDAVPPQAMDPDFQAKAEMAHWLAHPMEFGEPPDELSLYDTREILWPPTGDRRRVWLFRYVYHAGEGREKEDSGLGMVGSVTFALFGETTADLAPEDAYGLHCCWELEMNGDPRAPNERSAAAGRRLLGL